MHLAARLPPAAVFVNTFMGIVIRGVKIIGYINHTYNKDGMPYLEFRILVTIVTISLSRDTGPLIYQKI